MTFVPDSRTAAICVLGGFLFATGVIKVAGQIRGRLAWPAGPNMLRMHVPLWLAVAAEAVAGSAPLILGARAAALVLAIVYAGITLGAMTLQGRECACFGIEGLKVGRWHVGGCAVATLAAIVIALVPPASSAPPARLVWWIAVVVATIVALAVAGARKRREVEVSGEGCLYRAVSLHVLTLPDCGACAGLKLLYRQRSAGPDVEWYEVGTDELPSALRSLTSNVQYPCVVALDSAGAPTCPPREGLPQSQQVINTFLAQVAQ